MGKGGCSDNGRIFDANAVMDFVFFLEAPQNRYGVLHAGLTHQYRLKPALQGGIFFNVFAIFVEGRCPHTAQGSSGQRGLEHIGCIHRTLCSAGTHHGVKFIDKKDDLTFCGFDLF